MLNDFTGADQVYIACGYTDLRKGIDGLARLVQQQFELDPFTNTLFLFCGRRRDRIKGLYWEKDGFILLYKRLEMSAYQWPRFESEVKTLTPQQYRWLMEGLQIEQPKAHRPVMGLTTVQAEKKWLETKCVECIEKWNKMGYNNMQNSQNAPTSRALLVTLPNGESKECSAPQMTNPGKLTGL